jgi:hypothetical protein
MIERLLRKFFDHKEIGWAEIGEKFTRYFLVKSKYFNIYLHQLNAPNWHPECHDHPWSFLAILLKKGYVEECVGPNDTTYQKRRRPGSILWRPATFIHNVITPFGTSWSLIFTSPKSREWGFKPCKGTGVTMPYDKYRKLYGGSLNIEQLQSADIWKNRLDELVAKYGGTMVHDEVQFEDPEKFDAFVKEWESGQ